MGFGFNLFIAFVLPLLLLISTILGVYYLIKKEHAAFKKLIRGWRIFFLLMFLLIGVLYLIRFFTGKMSVSSNDVYGNYIIDRGKYPGKQANWQYDHYRFEITKGDSILFHVTDKDRILKTYSGTVQFGEGGRIALKIDSPKISIIDNRPTLYRNTFSFYYVFYSKGYNNVFFKKGNWKQ